MPIVSAWRGTGSAPNDAWFAARVSSASVLTRVRDPSDDVGSLKAMCPSRPTPSSARSSPPAAAMAASYRRQAAVRSAAVASGAWARSAARSTCRYSASCSARRNEPG